MAKKEKQEATEAVEAVASRGRKVMITPLAGGEAVSRADVIRELFNGGNGTERTVATGMKSVRGAIVKVLSEDYGHNIPYQIVFAATKATKAPKAKDEAAVEAAVEAAPEVEAEAAAE